MATIQIHKVTFLQNNPFGTFVAGDVLDVYLDTALVTTDPFSSAGVTVFRNGVLLNVGDIPLYTSFPFDDPTVIVYQDFGQQYCFGTYLILPTLFIFHPYGITQALPDNPSCTIGAPTCDLIIVGTASVTKATDESTADGSLTVTATSTNPIEYKLEDFNYGTGQVSGTFTDLLPGTYRVFVKDSVNCSANILVTVGSLSDYGIKYRLEYDCALAFTSKIEILERGYVGAVSEICGDGSPLQINLRGEGSTDKFQPILSSDANINLTSETDGFFSTLYTNDINLYRVNFYKDTGSGYELLWIGKILPFIYSEQIKSPPYYISVRATDGLPELKDFYLVQKDGQKFYGTVSLIKLVAYCLDLIGLDINIRVACNVYATTMATTSSDDPFDQAYIDYESFYLAEREPSMEFVLKSILEAFNCRLIQWDGVWNIVRIEETVGSYDYREFDSDGEYVSNGSFNPVVDVDYPNTNGLMWEAFPNLEMNKGYGQIKVQYRLGLKPNIINNGDFRLKSTYIPSLDIYTFQINTDGFSIVSPDYAITQGSEQIDEGNVAHFISGGEDLLGNTSAGSAYYQTSTYDVKMGTNNQLKINIRYKINRSSVIFGTTTYQIQVPYVKVRLLVKYGSLYLQNDGNWSTTVNTLDFFATTFNEYLESEVTAKYPTSGTPTSGMDFDIRLYHAYPYYAQFQSIASLQGLQTYDSPDFVVPTGYRTELRDDFTGFANMYYYRLEETTASASGYDIIRPTDYHSVNNPRQWVRQGTVQVGAGVVGANVFPFYVDRIKVTFLTDGKDPIDTIIRIANAEPLNKDVFEKELVIGSYSTLIVTETNFSIDLGIFFPNATPGITITTTNILSAELIYAGWLRSSSGVGYELWTRDGIAEESKLHAIFLSQYSAEYSRSWRLIRGAAVSRTLYFGLLNVIKDVNDSDRKYIPISLSLDDFNNSVSGEFLELSISTDGAGSDGSGSSPFSSGFTTGFGSSSFN